MMTLLLLSITLIYLFLIGSLIYGFDKVSDFKLENISHKTAFTIIIPFRNEAEYLPKLIQSLLKLDYTKTYIEFIFIDDESSDASAEIINKMMSTTELDYKLLKNIHISSSPKKDAITLGIKNSKHNWIITTDADCEVPKFWLDSFDCMIQNQSPKLIVAPVTLNYINSFFNRFQLLDILSLQGSTIGGFGIKKPFLCNGANLAYHKSLFKAIHGFKGNDSIASGDDIFILEKALKYSPNSIKYLKTPHAIVTTSVQANFTSLKAQRVRWASKTTKYNNWFGKLSGFIVLLMNATLICALTLSLINIISFTFLAYIYVIKFSLDFLLLFKTARFFKQEQVLFSYILSSLIYPFFSVYIAFIAVFSGYKWKGRSYIK